MEVASALKMDKSNGWLNTIVLICALGTILIGIVVLCGWALGFNEINSFGENFIPMAEESAILFLISGIALILIRSNNKSRLINNLIISSAVVIGVIAILALVDFATGYIWNLSDFIGSQNVIKEGLVIGKISFLTALCFIFLSVALLLLNTNASKYSPIFSITVLITGYTISVGYSFGVPYLYSGTTIPMAWPTAIAFMISSLGALMAIGKENVPICYFVEESTRARMLRGLLPLIFCIMMAQNYFEAYNNENFNNSSALIHSIVDILSLLAAGSIISFLSRSLGNSIDQNIAERKLVEKDLKRSEIELRKAQHITHIGSFFLDLTTNEVTWTEELYKMFGFDPALPPPPLKESQKLFTPESWTLLSTSIVNTIKTGVPFEIELKTIRKGGSYGWIWAQGEAINDTEGKLKNLWGVVQDITERKRIEEELKQAKEKAEGSDRLKSAFLANMSHEIRTPMNGILGFASLLKEPNLSGDEQQEYIAIIEKSGARMLNIINDIVDISKIESGLLEVHLTDININDKIEYIYNLFKPEAESKRLDLIFNNNFSDHEAIIETDEVKLFSIISNLVKNAIKYTDFGSIEFGYQLSPSISDKGQNILAFYIKDTGKGISPERHDAIFERFIQADIEDIEARQGAGLGLSIAKAYVEILGGRIWVESEEKKGSTFYVTIPYCAKSNKRVVIENSITSVNKENHFNPVASDLKILIVDDDETSELFLDILVEKISKNVFRAQTGNDAINICRNNPDIELIFMDIKMPDMNGYEATRQIREFNQDVIIIAQTAYALIGDREKAIKAGCNDYIAKPIDREKLDAMIRKYCTLSQ